MPQPVYRRTAAGKLAYLANDGHELSFDQRQVLRVLEEDTHAGMLGFLLPYTFEKLQALLGELSAKGFVELAELKKAG
jgi:hypothetical protein